MSKPHGPGLKASANGPRNHAEHAPRKVAPGGGYDTMVDAIAMSSPSGRMSKRFRAATSERLRVNLFGKEGLKKAPTPQPTEAARLRQQANELRSLAARGMKPRAYAKKAKELDARADSLG